MSVSSIKSANRKGKLLPMDRVGLFFVGNCCLHFVILVGKWFNLHVWWFYGNFTNMNFTFDMKNLQSVPLLSIKEKTEYGRLYTYFNIVSNR